MLTALAKLFGRKSDYPAGRRALLTAIDELTEKLALLTAIHLLTEELKPNATILVAQDQDRSRLALCWTRIFLGRFDCENGPRTSEACEWRRTPWMRECTLLGRAFRER